MWCVDTPRRGASASVRGDSLGAQMCAFAGLVGSVALVLNMASVVSLLLRKEDLVSYVRERVAAAPPCLASSRLAASASQGTTG